jgi:hypothetical protein
VSTAKVHASSERKLTRLYRDIVDTKPSYYDVCAVLFGAIDQAADNEDELPGSSGMTSPS